MVARQTALGRAASTALAVAPYAKEVAQYAWQHRDALVSGGKQLWNFVRGGAGGAQHVRAAIATATILRNPTYAHFQTRNMTAHGGQDGMRIVARGFLCNLGAATANVTAGVLNSYPLFNRDSMSAALQGFCPPVTADQLFGGNGTNKILVIHPVGLAPRVAPIARMFCMYRIGHFAVHYVTRTASTTVGAFALAAMETRSGAQQMADEGDSIQYQSTVNMARSYTGAFWVNAGNAIEYTSSEPTWFDCITNNTASEGLNYFAQPQNTTHTDTQLVLVGAQDTSVAPASYVNYGSLWYEIVVDFKDFCMDDTGMITSTVRSTPTPSPSQVAPTVVKSAAACTCSHTQ